ncbi:MAG: DNA alkylation repair protein [Acidobacteriota bacterium]|nr:DNA alkylation repair protein [Acidobacteriota bacterium]
MASVITPLQAAKQILKTLKTAGTSERAAQSRVYFKADEDVRFYGLKTPEVRQIELEFFASVKGVWTCADALQFCDLMIRESHLEAKQIGFELLARFKRQFPVTLLKTIKQWLLENHSANWATTDGLCSVVVTPLLQKHPELVEQLKPWTRDKNLWVRRVSAVALVGLARRGKHLDDTYQIAEALLGWPEDLIHKAVGWLLREAGKADEKRLEEFLFSHGALIPRTTLRYSIERFPAEKRSEMLLMTKSAEKPKLKN